MITVSRNESLTRAACPMLDNDQALRFLAEHALPPAVSHLEVPPGVVVRGTGFWLQPAVRNHPVATLFLVTTDPFPMEEAGAAPKPEPVLCYLSEKAKTLYLGRLVGGALESLLPNLYPQIPITSLTYVGRVVATC